MSAGADDFVNEPVAPDELAARLRVGERIVGLQTEVGQLEGLLLICSYCRKIRDVDNTWHEWISTSQGKPTLHSLTACVGNASKSTSSRSCNVCAIDPPRKLGRENTAS